MLLPEKNGTSWQYPYCGSMPISVGSLRDVLLQLLRAWTSFTRARSVLQVYTMAKSDRIASQFPSIRSLEHRLYWSCLKSVSEIRDQLPLPPSGLARLDYPLFPTLPEASACAESEPAQGLRGSAFRRSWFYYLAEISGRHVANRVVNSFYQVDQIAWLSSDLDRMVEHIPESVRWRESVNQSDELAFMLEGRVYYLYMLLYRPFLFIAIHSRDGPIDPCIHPFVQKCLKYCSEHTSSRVKTIKHRHHGTWFTARSLLSDGLTILAVVKRMNIDVPRDWPQQIQIIVFCLSY